MYLFFIYGIAIVMAIIGVVTYIRGRAYEKENVQVIETKYKKQIDDSLKEKQKELQNFEEFSQREIDSIIKSKEQWENRALEAETHTNQLLKSEQQRLAAELEKWKNIEGTKLTLEMGKRREDLEALYNTRNIDLQKEYEDQKEFYDAQILYLKEQLDDFKARQEAVNEAILRQKELEEKEDFYRILIKEDDIKDIEVLRSIESRLLNKEILNKLIYKTFIEKPLNDMEKRVLNGKKIGGIYKITYIKTGESYIGRSVDIGNRWKEHCLSSLSIGTIAHSTFHNILSNKGLQNFTWEIIEEVSKDKQNEREKYWINFYGTKNQFNEKEGG